MIAFIRARFPNTSANQVWSDTVAANWMDSTIRFSMAHYWTVSTFQQVNLSHVNFPAVVVNDPRKGDGIEADRDRLVRAALDAVDQTSHPDWDQFDRCIIFFAQATDLFGGGTHIAPNGKLITAAVFDIASGFDATCEEVGHALGLSHELDAGYNEYGCPYSAMSAPGIDLSFERAPDPRLPGVEGPTNPQRVVGPYIPTAHLYINARHPVNPNGDFNNPYSVVYVPQTYEHTPVNVRLFARDVAIAAWPNRRTVLAVVPPIVPGGDTHFLELRRRDGAYDKGIGNASIIILASNFFSGNMAVEDITKLRLRYIDRIDLEAVEGDLDYHSFSGRFVVRVSNSAPGFASVNLSIGGGNAWQDFRLTFDEQINNRKPTGSSDWKRGLIAPCPIESEHEFNYRVDTFQTFFVLQARSAGYELPGYAWKLQGVPLDPDGSALSLQVSCRDNTGQVMNSARMHTVQCTYRLKSGRLELSVASAFAAIVLEIEITVGETSPSVMKNFYPERTLRTGVRADNLGIEWDGQYQEAAKACWKRLVSSYNQVPELVVTHPGPGDPDPPFYEQIGIIVSAIVIGFGLTRLIATQLRSSRKSTFEYIYIDDNGNARELNAAEREYVRTALFPNEDADQFIKSRYESLTRDGRMNGYLRRRLLPRRIPVAPASQ